MPSRRERVIAALVAALEAGCMARVDRNRRDPPTPEDAPALNVIDGGHTPSYADFGDVAYSMQLDVEGGVVAETDALLGTAVNALYEQALDAAMADIGLGGECEQIREASFQLRIAPAAESTQPFAEFVLGLEIDFRTPDGNPAG